jgi:hypothetical protein
MSLINADGSKENEIMSNPILPNHLCPSASSADKLVFSAYMELCAFAPLRETFFPAVSTFNHGTPNNLAASEKYAFF